MEHLIRIIKQPHITERAARLREQVNQYVFRVAANSNKRDIKAAIEQLFKVKVLSVNTVRMPGKFRRMGGAAGAYKADWKKAIIRLQPGQEIKQVEETQ